MRLFRPIILAIAAVHVMAASPLLAANVGGTQMYANWSMQGKTSLSAGTTSSRVALPVVTSPAAYICNRGTVDAFVTFGSDNTVVATVATGSLVMAGNCQAFNLQPINSQWTYVAGITSSSTATLYIEVGLGHPQVGQSANNSGGGSTVTSDQGAGGSSAWLVTSGVGTYTNRSGTVTTGGTSQTLAAVNTSRKRLIIENGCAQTESLFVNFTSAASTSTSGGSIEIAPCGSYDSAGGAVSSELVTVTAATTGHPYIAKEM